SQRNRHLCAPSFLRRLTTACVVRRRKNGNEPGRCVEFWLRLLRASDVVLAHGLGIARVLRLLAGVMTAGSAVRVERGAGRGTGTSRGGARGLAALVRLSGPR